MRIFGIFSLSLSRLKQLTLTYFPCQNTFETGKKLSLVLDVREMRGQFADVLDCLKISVGFPGTSGGITLGL